MTTSFPAGSHHHELEGEAGSSEVKVNPHPERSVWPSNYFLFLCHVSSIWWWICVEESSVTDGAENIVFTYQKLIFRLWNSSPDRSETGTLLLHLAFLLVFLSLMFICPCPKLWFIYFLLCFIGRNDSVAPSGAFGRYLLFIQKTVNPKLLSDEKQ